MIRFLESYGRICLPKGIWAAAGIEVNSPVKIRVEGDAIVISKCEHRCSNCGAPSIPGKNAICAGRRTEAL